MQVKKFIQFIFCSLLSTVMIFSSITVIQAKTSIGFLDHASISNNQLYVSGWAYDQDYPTNAIKVRIYANSTMISEFQTNSSRADVNNAYGISGIHGYAKYFDISKWSTGTYTITAKAVSVSGVEYPLNNSFKVSYTSSTTSSYTTKYAPKGCVDLIQSNSNGIVTVAGWVYDLDSSSTSLSVKVYAGNTCISTLKADQSRVDVNNAFNITGNHGFSANISTTLTGSQTISIKAVDLGSNIEYTLGSKTVNLGGTQGSNIDTILDQWISKNITSSMTDTQKVQKIIQYALSFPYNYDINNAPEMIQKGSGECWANTDLVMRLCQKLGIPASVRTRSNTLSYPDFHIDNYVVINGQSYMVDCGHVDRTRYEFQTTKGYSYTTKSDGTLKITDYDGYSENLVIPSTIAGKKVTEIGKEAFIYHFETKSVVIPDTVTTIQDGAFKQCTALEKITIPSSVTTIASNAFTTTSKTMLGNTQLWIKDGIVKKTIIGTTNSRANLFANEQGYTFVSNGTTTTPTYTTKYTPQGCVDLIQSTTAGKVYVAGWAFDKDSSSTSIDVKVYIGSTCLGTLNANQTRADVNNAFGITGSHGFSGYVNTSLSGNQTVTVKMIDLQSKTEYTIKSQTINIPGNTATTPTYTTKYAPKGCVDLIQSTSSGVVTVAGWAYDLDSNATSLKVKVYAGSTCIATLNANQTRDDVNKAFNITGAHGYSANISTTVKGSQNISIKAVDLGTNTEYTIGSKTITILS